MIVSLFAGPGGACEGIHQATGQHPIGIERNPDAVATRDAAGHVTLVADLATMTPCDLDVDVDGLWASPPCPAFSTAGDREGHADLEHLCWLAARHITWGPLCAPGGWAHPDSQLIVNTLWWVKTHRPRWVAFEQVPAVAPVWAAACLGLEQLGYSTWSGVLNAADQGVPQTRQRAFLMASRDKLVCPPIPTHSKHPAEVPLWGSLLPWVSMADALGYGPRALAYNRGTGMTERHGDRAPTPISDPAPTITGHGKDMRWVLPAGETRCEPHELATLQGFRDGYPFQGSRTAQFRQIGDAVPPPMARAIVEALI